MTERSHADPAAVLASAAAVAGFAPSVHNTQPWRWRVSGDTLELYADRTRQLPATDPEGRLLIISCGTALHHVLVALAAEGWTAAVERMPDAADPDLLARVVLGAHDGTAPEAMRLLQAARIRHTDRRPVSETPPGGEALETVRSSVTAAGAELHRLTAEQSGDLAVAAAHAYEIEITDPAQRAELEYWVGGARRAGTGVPDEALPATVPQTHVPNRDFTRPGTLPVGEGHDQAAAYLLLYGASDRPVDWLRAGEALSAGWLNATELGLTMLPLSSVVEVGTTREALRRMLSGIGYPYLALRVGVPDPEHAGPAHTPRLPAEQVIDVVTRASSGT